jgi:stage V sporulation protein R
MANLCKLWGRPVHIETVVDEKPTVLSFDGSTHDVSAKSATAA